MFKLSEEQNQKLSEWAEEQNKKVAKSQEDTDFICKPYYGACGGGFSFTFTPTSLGVGVKVTNNITKETIDLTDYENW